MYILTNPNQTNPLTTLKAILTQEAIANKHSIKRTEIIYIGEAIYYNVADN